MRTLARKDHVVDPVAIVVNDCSAKCVCTVQYRHRRSDFSRSRNCLMRLVCETIRGCNCNARSNGVNLNGPVFGINGCVANLVVRRDHDVSWAVCVTGLHGIGRRVIVTLTRNHRCQLPINRDAIDRAGGGERLCNDVVGFGEMRIGVVRYLGDLIDDGADGTNVDAAGKSIGRRVASRIMHRDDNSGRAIRVTRLHRIGGRILIATDMVNKCCTAINGHTVNVNPNTCQGRVNREVLGDYVAYPR